jgi:membrane-bound lytic murein transglycosylase MltF
MKIGKKTIAWAIGMVALAVAVGSGIALKNRDLMVPVRDFPEIRASGILNIVTEYNSDGYYVSGDTLAGIQYDLCQYIEERSGLSVHVSLKNDWEDCLRMLENNLCDVIALNIPITSESKETVAFTIPITQNRQVLVQRNAAAASDSIPLIRNQMDLAYKTIWVPAHSPSILRLKNLSEEIAAPIRIHEVENYTQEQLLYLVAYGEADYAVADREIALKAAHLFPNLDVQTDVSFTQLQAWAVRKTSPALLDSLNRWMEKRGVKR